MEPKRDYLYIDDFLHALLATVNFKGFGYFNLGSGYSVSVKNIVELLLEISANPNMEILSSGIKREHEVMDVVANADKFKKQFKWMPKTDLHQGLSRIFDYEYKKL